MKNDSVVWLCFDAEHFEEIACLRPNTATWQGWSATMRIMMKKRMALQRARLAVSRQQKASWQSRVRKSSRQPYKSTRSNPKSE